MSLPEELRDLTPAQLKAVHELVTKYANETLHDLYGWNHERREEARNWLVAYESEMDARGGRK